MHQVRIARPVTDLARAKRLYCQGLGLQVVGSFEDHQGFDGVMLGATGSTCHFEFTHNQSQPVTPTPTAEDLVVFYVPDEAEWKALCVRMKAAGFAPVASFNPYWDVRGATFEDFDGYRIVLTCDEWPTA
jgi:catechol 2,3-dioxygenase-like lactoylglutathione lyase family enzyme